MLLLALLYVVANYVPMLKIVPLIASLELFSFFTFHLLGQRRRLQLQGFLGGFISSTAVYLQVLNDPKYANSNERELSLTLLLALCAMLVECLFIVFFLSNDAPLHYYLPFALQLAFFLLVIVYFSLPQTAGTASGQAMGQVDIDLLNDRPIIWKNVAKLSLLLFLIIGLMHFIGNEFAMSRHLSTLFISLFEAHAVLASLLSQDDLLAPGQNVLTLFFVILLGNALSKTFFVLRGKNLKNKIGFIGLLWLGLLSSAGLTYLSLI
jgi:uncharacterized membrane protein (DUF4010 family)